MVRVLMCGSVASSGGVSIHTKNLVENLSEEGIEVIFYNYYKNQIDSKNTNFGKVYRRTFGLFFQILSNREKYEIIHDQTSGGIFSFISSITASIASRIVNKKLIITFHHSNKKFVEKYKICFNFVLKYANTMIFVSNKQKEFISDLFPKYCSKLIVIPNGFDPEVFFPRDQLECRSMLGIPKDKKIIVNVSNLIDSKGHKYLIHAMSKVIEKDPQVLCYTIGMGPCKEKLEKLIHQYQLEDSFILLGWKPNSEIPYWLNASDLFVFPSLNESFGIVQIEAMACGKPVIATRNWGSEGILTSKDYGILCNTGNVDELSINISAGLKKSWDLNSITKYAKRFEWKCVSKATISTYNSICEEAEL
jgi:glycosyltransferase involved in cell wall biosynthesis